MTYTVTFSTIGQSDIKLALTVEKKDITDTTDWKKFVELGFKELEKRL